VITGALLLVDELVEFRIVVVDPLGTAGAKVLIEIDIGVAAVAAGVVEGRAKSPALRAMAAIANAIFNGRAYAIMLSTILRHLLYY
jgi:hypothetical protein